MDNLRNQADLLRAFTKALEADLAISPMIVVSTSIGGSHWSEITGTIGMVAEAIDGHSIVYDLKVEQVEDLTDWIGRGYDGRPVLVDVVTLVVDGSASSLDAMLLAARDHAAHDVLLVVATQDRDLAMVQQAIERCLSVPALLVPTLHQNHVAPRDLVTITAEGSMFSRSNGRYVLDAQVSLPYPHEIEIFVDPGDLDDDAMFKKIEAFGPDFPFATNVTIADGELRCSIGDILAL